MQIADDNQDGMLKYYLAKDTVDHSDINELISWLKTYPRLTKGQVTLQFEKKWSDWLGTPYSVLCNSGSSANLLMYWSLPEYRQYSFANCRCSAETQRRSSATPALVAMLPVFAPCTAQRIDR